MRHSDVIKLPPPIAQPERTHFMRRDEIQRVLDGWKAPRVSDEVLEAEATLFLSSPWASVVPLAAWLDARGVR